MATGKKKVVRLYGPWKGVNEWPGECEEGEVEDAWNVDFTGDVIATRGGRRQIYAAGITVLPTHVFRMGSSTAADAGDYAARTDYTLAATDGDGDTWLNMGFFGRVLPAPGGSDCLYIGFPFPVDNLTFTIGSGNTSASVLSVTYYQRGTGWAAVAGKVDGTIVATGKTLGQTGNVTWTMPTDWAPSQIPRPTANDAAGWVSPTVFELHGSLYWVRLTVSAVLSATVRVQEIRSSLSGVGTGAVYPINGLYQWNRPGGERSLIVGIDDTATGIARLFEVDRYQGKLRAITIPAEISKSAPDAIWNFATTPDGLVACNGYNLMFATNAEPRRLRPFKRIPFVGNKENVVPSAARYVAICNDLLFVVNSDRPNTLQVSQPAYPVTDWKETKEAPLGGLHLFWGEETLTVIDPTGGAITGMVAVGGTLVVFTPRSTWAVVGIGTSEPALDLIDSDVGCIAPKSIALVGDTVFFLGAGGIYAYTGGSNTLISRKIEPTFRGLNQMALTGACGTVFKRKSQYRLHVPAGIDAKNNIVLCFDYQRKAWTKYGLPEYLKSSGAVSWARYNVKLALAVGDDAWSEELIEVDYLGNLIAAEIGHVDNVSITGSTPTAAGIFSMFVTDRIKGEDQGPATARYIRLRMRTEGESLGSSINITAGLLRDGATWKKVDSTTPKYFTAGEQTATFAQIDDATTEARQVYGQARIGYDSWRAKRFLSFRGEYGLTGRTFQIAVYNPRDNAMQFRIRGLEIEFLPRDGRR